MQVDAVGEVDAIGFDKPRCNLCKTLGHAAEKCWFKGKGGAKGDSKGGKGDGGKGGSKGGRGGNAPSNDKDKTCHYCKKKGHIKINCFKFKQDQEDRKKGTVSIVEKEAAEVSVMVVPGEDDSDERGFCVALASDYVDHDSGGHQVGNVDHGSNGHQVGFDGCESFGDQLEGEFACHACDDTIIMAIGGGANLKECDVDDFLMLDGVCKANFKVGPFARNLLSTGRVYDAGFDVVYSHNDGCCVGYSKPDGRYVKIPMARGKNTFGAPASLHKDFEDAKEVAKETKRLQGRYPDQQSGIVAANEDAVVKDEGAVQEQRLKELGAAIYGAKGQLWARLEHAELKRNQDLDFKKAVEERYQQQVGGQPVTEAKVVEDLHIKQPVCGSNAREELIVFDWAFNGTKDTGDLCDEADKGLGAFLVAADRSAGLLYGDALGGKAAGDHAVKQLMRFMKQLAYQKPELRCDTGPAVKALQDKGRTRDSKSMGFIETRVRWWRGRLKANRVQVEMNYGIKLAPHSPLWPFLAHHAANVMNWRSRGADGYTAHFAVDVVNYIGAVVSFAEAVVARVPVSKTGQRRSMGGLVPRRTKAGAAWVKGIWVGKTTNNDERIILAIAGKVTCRAARRMPKGKRRDRGLLLKVCGEPWREKLAHMPRSLVMGGGRGEVAPTPLEVVGAETLVLRPRRPGLLRPRRDLAERGRYEDPIVGAIEDISETLDYKALLTAKELTHWDSSGFPQEEAAEALDKGLKLCDEFGIYSVHPRAAADGNKKVDTKWEKKDRAGVLNKYRLGLELHMGDFYCTGRKSEVENCLPMIRAKLKLKDSDVVAEGRFGYLKRTRIKTDEGIFVQPREKHALDVITELGLMGANPVKTPDLGSEEVLEQSPPLVDRQIARYLSCVGSGLYLAQDRTDIQRAVGLLASDLAAAAELSWKRLLRLGRNLVGASDLGVFTPKVDMRIYKKGAVHLRSFSDSDHGGKGAKRKSTTCGVLHADGVALATPVRRQDLIAVSSGESEFYALSTVAMGGNMLRDVLTWFGFRVEWTLETDSSAARAMSLRQGVGEVRHLDARSLWVQQAARALGLKVLKCNGTENPSDIGAKPRTSEVHEQLCKQVGLRRLNGDLGAVREVEVNAVIEKLGRTACGTQC
ncbi:unnamed protein product, partial [Prorocentrum cordatum]